MGENHWDISVRFEKLCPHCDPKMKQHRCNKPLQTKYFLTDLNSPLSTLSAYEPGLENLFAWPHGREWILKHIKELCNDALFRTVSFQWSSN
jgi:hypothetical protein